MNLNPFNRAVSSGGLGNTLGVNPNDKEYASKVNAALARRDWQDYQRKFMPIHGIYKDMVMSDKLVNQQLERIPDNIDKAYARQEQGAAARMQRMGLSEVDMGRVDMNKALDQVSAENSTRQHAKDRSLAAIAGAPMPTSGG